MPRKTKNTEQRKVHENRLAAIRKYFGNFIPEVDNPSAEELLAMMCIFLTNKLDDLEKRVSLSVNRQDQNIKAIAEVLKEANIATYEYRKPEEDKS